MSYSVSNVLAEAGIKNVMRWVPFEMDEVDLRNRIKNKMIRPTTIPQTLEELMVEQAISREALRLAFEQHKLLAVGLKGVQQERTISDTFSQSASGETLVNLMALDMLVGSGGVLSHAPRRVQSALMMMDAFQPEGVTELTVDSIFMMPQLGVLSTVHPKAATEVFRKDCLIRLGSCIAPVGLGKEGSDCVRVRVTRKSGEIIERKVAFGEVDRIDLPEGETAEAAITPERSFDVGEGKGKTAERKVSGGVAGIIVDARGRPLPIPEAERERVAKLTRWLAALDVYPPGALKR
jgi:hypothetical protein